MSPTEILKIGTIIMLINVLGWVFYYYNTGGFA